MSRALIPIALVAGCAPAVQPTPEQHSPTQFASEACTRRIAQLAAPYHAHGIRSQVSQAATVLPGGRYRLGFEVGIDYGAEQRTAQIICTVTAAGRVEQIEGMAP